MPGVAFTTAMGAIFNPIGVAVAAGLGAALGELTGYMTGFSGQGVMERAALYERLVKWMKEHQNLAYLMIALVAFIPESLFRPGWNGLRSPKLPLWKFLIACAFGKILKMLLFAYAGFFSYGWLCQFHRSLNVTTTGQSAGLLFLELLLPPPSSAAEQTKSDILRYSLRSVFGFL